MDKKCKYCNKTFGDDVAGRVFSNHVRWCDQNPTRNDTEGIRDANHKWMDDKLGPVTAFVVTCQKCCKEFVVNEREKSHPKKDIYFCSRACANTRVHSVETKNKIKESLVLPRQTRVCLQCNEKFDVIVSSKKRYCCAACVSKSRKSATEFLDYKNACKFSFNVWDFPEEFDLGLIYKHGWYKAKNRGDNLGGVSRDHRISINFGWANGIDPEIMRHPANCKLMVHSDNISKHKKCSVLLEQLVEDISSWNEKYK